jgi:hypothetical protein
MPINPNIALGVQQQQPVNMLGQMGQVMALRAAQQEIEGNEGVKSYFARPSAERGNPTDLAQYGRQGRETLKALNESQIKQLEADQKRINLVGAGAGAVLNNPTMETFTTVVSDLVKRGIYTPEQRDQAFAAIGNDPSKIKSFVQPIFDQAISAEKRLADITSRRNQDVASGASYLNAQLNREKFNDERLRGRTIAGENQFLREDIYGNLSPVGSYGTQFGPNAPVAAPVGGGGAPALPPAAANAFVASRPSVNAFAPTAAPQGAGPTVAAAAALDQQANIPRPKQPFRAPVAVMQGNESILVPADKAIGMQPATAFTEKQAFGKTETVRNLGTAIANLTDAIKPGGLLEQSTGSGLGRAVDASNAFFGRATEGAIAAAKLAPIADLVLKMIPRFEGPQSDKDTQSYKEAAGQLANASLPNEIRKGAAEVIIKLMKERREQFGMTDQVGGSGGAGATADPLGIR